MDFWALGVIYAEMLLGKPLFIVKNDFQLINSIIELIGSPSEQDIISMVSSVDKLKI